jgi:hypothetical protein
MEAELTREDWETVVNRTHPIEFGWIGADQYGRLGYFSTYGKAYIPNRVLFSFKKYLGLANLINSLPDIGRSTLYIKSKGWFDDWHLHSRQGIVGYDYQDAHREVAKQLNRYDLISIPEHYLKLDSNNDILSFEDIIPRFQTTFDDNLSFETLQKAEM